MRDVAGWDKLIAAANGRNQRALSPNMGIVMDSSLSSGSYEEYINQVWTKYSTDLYINTQSSYGTVVGSVSNNLSTFDGVGSFTQPSTADIITCVTAAFNRSTLHLDAVQPDDVVTSEYYQNPVTNHYARICHATSLDGRGYGFPYDDVGPKGDVDQSGAVNDPNPQLLTVVVGGTNDSSQNL
ncbi:hypothetical protein M432DRAFT_642469 [Thermoascus aurantiacus ATCC 26904]